MRSTPPSHPSRAAAPHPARVLACVCALLLTLLVSLHTPTRAAAADGDPLIGSSDATAAAPTGITFALTAASDEPITRVELFWRAAAQQEYRLVRVDAPTQNEVAVTYSLDTRLNYIPPGIDVHWLWQVTDAGDDVTRSDESTVTYLDPSQDWTVVTSATVDVYWQDADSTSDADPVIAAVEGSLATLSARFDIHTERPLRIVLFHNRNTFKDALPPGSAEWIGGQAHTTLDVFVASMIPGSTSEVRRLVPHEVVHLALAQETANPWTSPPQWLDEGLAVYMQDQVDEDMRDALDEAVDDGELIPLPALQSAFPWDADRAILSYAESWSVVDYLIETYGDVGMAALIDAIGASETGEEAVLTAFGRSLEQIDSDWKAWLGYTGDAPISSPGLAATDGDDDSGPLDPTSFAISITVGGIGIIAGLGMLIYGIIRLRRIPRSLR